MDTLELAPELDMTYRISFYSIKLTRSELIEFSAGALR